MGDSRGWRMSHGRDDRYVYDGRIQYVMYRDLPGHLLSNLMFDCESQRNGGTVMSECLRHQCRSGLCVLRQIRNPPEIRGDFYARDYFAAGFCDSCEASGAAVF